MLDDVFQALAEPRRRVILELIQARELSSGDIAAHFDVTRPAISQHLRVLEEAGLVRVRREGTRRLYRTRPEGFEELKAFLDRFWDVQLSTLKQAAEAEGRENPA
jgi:DNA-binding transcriptional ArsR family regulator